MQAELADAVRALPHRPGVYCFRDRRSKALYLTAKGKRLLQRLKPEVADHERRLARHLSRRDRSRLVELLQKIFPEHR